jgi:AraC-like DNA-binding protein
MAPSHGILNPRAAEARVSLTRGAPPADIEAFVQQTWTATWDLRGRPPHEQQTLPAPFANMVIGTHRPGVFGVWRSRFVARLEGEGWVVAVKFRPGGLRPFVARPMSALTDREFPIAHLFGEAGAEIERAVHAAEPAERGALIEAFLRARAPAADQQAALAARIVDLARSDRELTRVDDLGERSGLSVRALQRLFREYVGVSPKWVIRRFRVQEAAERLATGQPIDAAAFASELAYYDQAHFIRDFKAQVGRTPSAYAAICAARR